MASLKGNGVLLGSFSKIVSPGMRIGWICASKDIMDRLVIAKQASDLHTSYFTQRVVHRYMVDNDVDAHIQNIKKLYRSQRDAMVTAIDRHFPEGVECTKPEGGMFLWAKLPGGLSSLELFDMAIKENVAFVPGHIFFTDGTGGDTMRLNYTNADEATIEEGIKRLSEAISSLMRRKN
jgi:2-aminoadipate transaminase